MFIAMADDFHLAAGLSEKLVIFGASFSGTGFGPAWAQGDAIVGDGFE